MMILKVLDGLELSGDTIPGDGARNLLAKPKLTAIVVYLLLAKQGNWCRRDALAAMFWPESDQAHARSALSQSLYQIRQHLGSDVLEKRGNEDVRLTPGVITSDAVTVTEALDGGRPEDALAAYGGELLPAFHIPDDGTFSHWLDQERASLSNRIIQAAWSAAEAAEREGQFSAARSWLGQAADLSPLDGDTVARAMAGLSRTGDPKAALALYDRHKTVLADQLECKPDEAVVTLAEKIHNRLAESKPTYRSTPPPEAELVRASPRTGPRSTRNLRFTSAIIGAIVMLVVVFVVAPFTNRPALLDSGLVAVMPFGFQGPHEADAWLASAFPVALVPLLDGVGGIRAVPEQRMGLALEMEGLSWNGQPSADQSRTLARAVGAGRYLSATVVSDGVHRSVTASLTDSNSGEELQHVEVAIDTLDINAAIDRVVAELLIAVAGQIPHAETLLSQSAVALRDYVDGWVARREERHLDALRHFHRAMDLDSTFALAALAYREVSMWLPDGTPHRLALQRADSMVRRHPERLSGADRAISDAIFYTHRLTNDGFEALEGIRRATLVAPARSSSWLLLGDFLLHDGAMLALPNHTRLAAAAFDSARALGDLTPEAERHLIEIRLAARDVDFAREYLAEHPPNPAAFNHLWWVAASLAGDSASLREFGRTLHREGPSTWMAMILWSQRAETGFPQADSAAQLLAANPTVDRLIGANGNYAVGFYWLNRGRPVASQQFPFARFGLDRFGISPTDPAINQSTNYGASVIRLEEALVSPATWIDVDAAGIDVEESYDRLDSRAQLPAACNLGLWHAAHGRSARAIGMAQALETWFDDPNFRRRAYARVCPVVIRAALETGDSLPALSAVDSLLLSEPAGLLRHDITRWNLYLARIYADRGHPERGLPLTTRLGFLVEQSAWLTPALLLEAELSQAVGDTERTEQAMARASRLMSGS